MLYGDDSLQMFVPRKRRVAQRKEREEVAPSALPSSNCVGDLAIVSCLFSLHVWTRLYPSRAALSLASLFLQAARCYWSHLSRNIPGKTRSKTGTFKRHPKHNGALVFEEAAIAITSSPTLPRNPVVYVADIIARQPQKHGW